MASPSLATEQLGPMRLAVTVDDLPVHGDAIAGLTRMDIALGVLKALKNNRVPQTYGFANGYLIDDQPELIGVLKEWLKAGFPLGNHTYSHTDLDKVTVQAYMADIGKLDHLLQTLAPVSPLIEQRHVFRYPYLHEGDSLEKRDAVRRYLLDRGYTIAQVTVDYNDWTWTNAYTRCLRQHDDASIGWLEGHVVAAAEGRLRASKRVSELLFHRDIVQILLIHDGAFDALMLDRIFKDLRAKGVTFVSLNQALADPAYKINPNRAFNGEKTFLQQVAKARNINIDKFSETTYTLGRLNAVCEEPRHNRE